MIPPLATARTTARDVQLRGVPVPTQRSGCEVSTARAFRGTAAATAVASTSGAAAAASGTVIAPATARPRYARTGCRYWNTCDSAP